jgi:anthranilate phosphoribosyltransferase
MKHAGPVRAKLGIPTVFNTLGPLSHPAFLTRQIVGVPSLETAKKIANVLQSTGTELGMVVTGHNGLDEFSTTGPNIVHMVTPEIIEMSEISPTDLGIKEAEPEQIFGGNPQENVQIANQVLNGNEGPKSDIIVLNAAAGLVVAGIASDLIDGIERARSSIVSGAAKSKMQDLRNFTKSLVPNESE